MPQARLAEGHGFVVVVQVAARSRAVEIGAYERDLRREEPSADRSHVGHRVKQRVSRRGSRLVGLGGGGLFGEMGPVILREPGQRRHVELIGRRRGRGVQEAFAVVVDQVFAVVRAVEQGR